MQIFKAERPVSKGFGGAVASALLMTTALGTGAIVAPTVAHAQAQAYDIPAGSLAAALNRFIETSGVALVYDSSLTNGHSSPGLKGSFGTAEALSRLLTGTGLTFRQTGPAAFTLERAPQSADGAIQLGPVRVEGDTAGGVRTAYEGELTATSPVKGYVARRSASGTKTDTPIIETPQSISVVTAEEMRTTKAQNLTDALTYTAGVYRTEGNDRTADRINLRGFYSDAIEGSLYRDGMRYMVNAFNGKQEPYGLERVEILKGASSVLYGNAGPGGIINTVTKRPSADPVHEINLELGSFDRKQLSFDLGGAISDDSVWSYRLTALQRDSNTFVDFVPDDRTYIAPALKWQPTTATSLTILSHYQESHTKYVFGFPASGTIESNPNGSIPVSRYSGEPDRDRADNRIYSASTLFEHRFSDALLLRQNFSYFHSKTSQPATWPLAEVSNRVISRFAESIREDRSEAFTADLSLEYRWQTGRIENTTLMGVDHTFQQHRSERWLNFPADLDLYDPVYGVPYTSAEFMRGYPASRKERTWLTGLYGQNQAKIADKWVVLMGGRMDWAKKGRSPIVGPEAWEDEKSRAFTGRAGLAYLADNGLAPFISWSQSYQPQAGTDRSGNRFKPTTGEQYEIGLRYQPADRNMMVSATVYQLTRQNVTTSDQVDDSYSVQTGELRSRGFELEAKAQVSPLYSLIGAYTYIDAKTTRSNIASEVGRRTGAVPHHQLALWNDFDLSALGIAGLKIGGGARYVGSSTGTYIDVRVPGSTLYDALISYARGSWQLTVNVSNLTDKTYVTNCIDVCYYGEPRRVIGTLAYRW